MSDGRIFLRLAFLVVWVGLATGSLAEPTEWPNTEGSPGGG